jgi:hypothetical protein
MGGAFGAGIDAIKHHSLRRHVARTGLLEHFLDKLLGLVLRQRFKPLSDLVPRSAGSSGVSGLERPAARFSSGHDYSGQIAH